ncbi:MAG: tetratricopeptide repeat protein [Flavobacteriales bacterium]|nr:tetratricopeptide repeat protein [Flavobacteriales bacterium]
MKCCTNWASRSVRCSTTIRSLAISDARRDTAAAQATYINAAALFLEQGDTTRALDYYERSIALNEASTRHRDLAIGLYNVGIIRTARRQFDQARPLLSCAFHRGAGRRCDHRHVPSRPWSACAAARKE